ncbi:Hypothetical_protein [Hexamita inflata]|uniref:Hypothetical_protein n=1 Tax=Hexamita inflata TaxID=28002 RepID=A0AA86QMT7_9EUKA|nr:Hypothetical protein HINF_LOCUS44738 [Hexamita inflata]
MHFMNHKLLPQHLPQHLNKIPPEQLEPIKTLHNDTRDFHIHSFSLLKNQIQNKRKKLKGLFKIMNQVESVMTKNTENMQTLISNAEAQRIYLQYLSWRNQ